MRTIIALIILAAAGAAYAGTPEVAAPMVAAPQARTAPVCPDIIVRDYQYQDIVEKVQQRRIHETHIIPRVRYETEIVEEHRTITEPTVYSVPDCTQYVAPAANYAVAVETPPRRRLLRRRRSTRVPVSHTTTYGPNFLGVGN